MALSRPAYAHPRSTSFPQWTTRAATENDLKTLARNLSVATEAELGAFSRYAPLSTLLMGLGRKPAPGELGQVVFVDTHNPSQPVALFDFKPVEGTDKTAMWACLSERINRSEALFSLTSYVRTILDLMSRTNPTISCFVDARNIDHQSWLEDLGFKLVETLPQFGHCELKFYHYERTNTHHV